jgi:putative ABC transport system ATP-binding protein
MISISGLTKVYGTGEARTRVLQDVDLTIDAGEFLSIIGTSGSGKTTLLNIIGGLDRSWQGTVRLGDHDLGALTDSQLAHVRNETIGFVFQQFNLLDHLSALENVALPSFFADDGFKDPHGRARELLGRMGLGDKLDVPPPKLSGGQKQRVAIARALFARPSVILCDEPTGSLDRGTGVSILELFRELNREEGITLVMVTHEEHIARMSERIIRLEDGVIVADVENDPVDPRDEILAHANGSVEVSA